MGEVSISCGICSVGICSVQVTDCGLAYVGRGWGRPRGGHGGGQRAGGRAGGQAENLFKKLAAAPYMMSIV